METMWESSVFGYLASAGGFSPDPVAVCWCNGASPSNECPRFEGLSGLPRRGGCLE